MICYKVVCKQHDGRLMSFLYSFLPSFACKEYSLNYETEADFGGLLVFRTRKAAREFARREKQNVPTLQIYKAICDEPVPLVGWSLLNSVIRDVWSPCYPKSLVWPDGTLAFKRVRLWEKIS